MLICQEITAHSKSAEPSDHDEPLGHCTLNTGRIVWRKFVITTAAWVPDTQETTQTNSATDVLSGQQIMAQLPGEVLLIGTVRMSNRHLQYRSTACRQYIRLKPCSSGLVPLRRLYTACRQYTRLKPCSSELVPLRRPYSPGMSRLYRRQRFSFATGLHGHPV